MNKANIIAKANNVVHICLQLRVWTRYIIGNAEKPAYNYLDFLGEYVLN